MTRKNTLSKAEKARRQAAADALFNRPTEEKKEKRLSNQDVKMMESGLSDDDYRAFTAAHGFEYLQTFNQWKNNGYQIKAGSKAKKILLFTRTASGNWKEKAYYYFTFEQVQKRQNPEPLNIDEVSARYDWRTCPKEIWNRLNEEQRLALMPF